MRRNTGQSGLIVHDDYVTRKTTLQQLRMDVGQTIHTATDNSHARFEVGRIHALHLPLRLYGLGYWIRLYLWLLTISYRPLLHSL